MGEVGAEQHPVDTDVIDQAGDVLLVERAHRDVAAEGLHRIFGELLGHFAVGLGELRQQRGHPGGAVLDTGHPHIGMALEQAVTDHCGNGVEDGPAVADDQSEGGGLERQELVAAALPVAGVGVIAGVGGVAGDQDSGLLNGVPEVVKLGQSHGAGTPHGGHRGGADQHSPGPVVHSPLQLLDGPTGVGQGDDRGGEDAVLVVEGPLVQHPAVEGRNGGVGELDVVLHPLFEQRGQGGEQQRGVHPLLVEQLEAVVGVAEGGQTADWLAGDLAQGSALGVVAPVVFLPGAGSGDHIEGGVGDVLADLVVYGDFGASLDVHVADGAAVVLGQVAGEGVDGLVEVVVGVVDVVVEVHGSSGERTLGIDSVTRTVSRAYSSPVSALTLSTMCSSRTSSAP